MRRSDDNIRPAIAIDVTGDLPRGLGAAFAMGAAMHNPADTTTAMATATRRYENNTASPTSNQRQEPPDLGVIPNRRRRQHRAEIDP